MRFDLAKRVLCQQTLSTMRKMSAQEMPLHFGFPGSSFQVQSAELDPGDRDHSVSIPGSAG